MIRPEERRLYHFDGVYLLEAGIDIFLAERGVRGVGPSDEDCGQSRGLAFLWHGFHMWLGKHHCAYPVLVI